MNVQLAIVGIAVAAAVFYVVRRVVRDWRHMQGSSCSACPIAKFRPPL